MSAWQVIAALLLGSMALHRYVLCRPSIDMGPYHGRVRESVKAVPSRIGSWVGEDVPVPPRAIRVLAPNLMVSRSYMNVETGVSARLLLVHCSDAHDMVGHFPLRCYRAEGWELASAQAREWTADGLVLQGMEYKFVRQPIQPGAAIQTMVVANCLLQPSGRILRDMDSLSKNISSADAQAAGAGQIQVSFNADVSQASRDAAVAALASGYRPVLDAILAPTVP